MNDEDKPALDSAKGPCGICQGKFSEHGEGLTQHAWVPEGSREMLTHLQARNKARQTEPQQPMVIRAPTNGIGPLQRLIEVLSNRGDLSNKELMYITGITAGEVHDDGDGAGATPSGRDRRDRQEENAE